MNGNSYQVENLITKEFLYDTGKLTVCLLLNLLYLVFSICMLVLATSYNLVSNSKGMLVWGKSKINTTMIRGLDSAHDYVCQLIEDAQEEQRFSHVKALVSVQDFINSLIGAIMEESNSPKDTFRELYRDTLLNNDEEGTELQGD